MTRRTAPIFVTESRLWESPRLSARLSTLAERFRRASYRLDSPRVSGSRRHLQRAPSAPRPLVVRRLLPTNPHSSIARQGLPRLAPGPATQDRKSRRHPAIRWPASPLRTAGPLTRPSAANQRWPAAHRLSFEVSVSKVFDLEPGSVNCDSARSPFHSSS